MDARRWLLTLGTVCLLVSAASAAEVRGVITKIDPAKNELVVDIKGVLAAKGELMTLYLPADATVQIGLVGPQPGTLKSLAAGQRVRVVFDDRNGKKMVQLVRIVALLSPSDPPAGNPNPNPNPLPPTGNGAGNVVSGTLRYIGLSERDILLAHAGAGGKEAYTPIQVPETARINRDKQQIRLEDLKSEEAVAVQFEMKDGKRVALAIQAGESADLPFPTPMPGQPAAPQRGARLKNALQQMGQMVDQAGQGKGPIVMDPQTALKIRKLLAAGEQGIQMMEEQGGANGGNRLAMLRQGVQMGMKLTAEIASGNAPKELDINIDPKLAASLNQVLGIADQVLYFVEQERAALANR